MQWMKSAFGLYSHIALVVGIKTKNFLGNSYINESFKTHVYYYTFVGKNLTNQKSLTSLGNRLVIAGALVQHALE